MPISNSQRAEELRRVIDESGFFAIHADLGVACALDAGG